MCFSLNSLHSNERVKQPYTESVKFTDVVSVSGQVETATRGAEPSMVTGNGKGTEPQH